MQIVNSFLKKFFETMGFKIVRLSQIATPVYEQEFEQIYSLCKEYTMTSKERMFALYNATKYIVESNIPGDFVECGVWRGGSAMLIALTLKSAKSKKRKIYLYDTYEGMVKPTKEDISAKDGSSALVTWDKSKNEGHNDWCYSSLDEVKSNMAQTGYSQGDLVFVKGLVEKSIPFNAPKKIALLRLDTDWYISTKHELTHLFPRLFAGGVLIIDDYGDWEGARKAVNEYFSKSSGKVLLNMIDHTGRIGVKLK